MKMKADGRNRRKVVVRQLPPSLSPSQFFDQTDRSFSDRYNWACYRPGTNSSRKNQRCSRAYIEFKVPEDVLHFADLFDGHIFINEMGVQYKATVEYAPSQSVPKPSVKDGRDGTIFIDPEYLEFLKLIAEPFEIQRIAGNQLEIKETDQIGEFPVVTPLMEFVRKRRTTHSVTQALNGNCKVGRRATRGKPHSTFVKNNLNKEKNTRDKSQSTKKNNLEKDHANSSLGEKKSLFHKAKETKIFEASSLSSGTAPCNRKVDSKILQNGNQVHEPNNTSNSSLTCDATTTSQGEAKKIPYGHGRGKGFNNSLDNCKVKEPQLYLTHSGDASSSPSQAQTARVPNQGMNDRKPSKRGTGNRRGAHEKQVWVQKFPSSAGE